VFITTHDEYSYYYIDDRKYFALAIFCFKGRKPCQAEAVLNASRQRQA
jgi:hypothetical protein